MTLVNIFASSETLNNGQNLGRLIDIATIENHPGIEAVVTFVSKPTMPIRARAALNN